MEKDVYVGDLEETYQYKGSLYNTETLIIELQEQGVIEHDYLIMELALRKHSGLSSSLSSISSEEYEDILKYSGVYNEEESKSMQMMELRDQIVEDLEKLDLLVLDLKDYEAVYLNKDDLELLELETTDNESLKTLYGRNVNLKKSLMAGVQLKEVDLFFLYDKENEEIVVSSKGKLSIEVDLSEKIKQKFGLTYESKDKPEKRRRLRM